MGAHRIDGGCERRLHIGPAHNDQASGAHPALPTCEAPAAASLRRAKKIEEELRYLKQYHEYGEQDAHRACRNTGPCSPPRYGLRQAELRAGDLLGKPRISERPECGEGQHKQADDRDILDQWERTTRTSWRAAVESGRASLIGAADEHVRSLMPLLRSLEAEGAITIGGVTRALNARQIPTARGSQWHVSSVANLLARVQKLGAAR